MKLVHVIHVLILCAGYLGAMEPQSEKPTASASNNGKLKAVMLVGPTQSGKSTLAAAIKECCATKGYHPQMVCMDIYRSDMRAGHHHVILSYHKARNEGKTKKLHGDALDAYAQMYGFNRFIAQSLEQNDRFFVITYLSTSTEARNDLVELLRNKRHEIFLVKLLCSRQAAQSRMSKEQFDVAWQQHKPAIPSIKDRNPKAADKNEELLAGKIRSPRDIVEQYSQIDKNPAEFYGLADWQYDMEIDSTEFSVDKKKKEPDEITGIVEEIRVPGKEYYQVASQIVSRLFSDPS